MKLINYLFKNILFILFIYVLSKINFSLHTNFVTNFEKYINETINMDIYKNETFPSRYEAFCKAKKFLNNCLREKYIKKGAFNISEKPEISAVIPMFNCSQFIGKTVKSIQNQNINNIEIILVNDYSPDKTLSVVKKLSKEDPRIKIINNKKNMGILYSRSIGSLLSKGNYLFHLDNDDMFLDKDVFKTISNIAYENNIEIVEFKGIFQVYNEDNLLNETTINDTKFQTHKSNLVLFQPELGNYPLKEASTAEEMFNDVYLWAKCIKTSLYKEAIIKLGEKRISKYILIFEDIYVNYVLFNLAKSFKFVNKYGIFRIKRENSASNIWGQYNEMNKSFLYLLDIVLEFSRNIIYNKQIVVFLVIYILNRYKLLETLNLKKRYKKLCISCLNRILCSNYISSKSKMKIKILSSIKLGSINYFFHKRICINFYS